MWLRKACSRLFGRWIFLFLFGCGLFVLGTVAEDLQRQRVLERFESDIYPLMTRFGEDSCVGCHEDEDTSSLVFVGNAQDDFQILLDQGYLALEGPDTFLARIVHSNPKRRMPKGASLEPWSAEEVERLRSFLKTTADLMVTDQVDDTSFPAALLNPYQGTKPGGYDNQFLTYSQLQGKVKAIFEADWVREGKDMFQEHVAFFNGADFVTRFNESSEASSSFLVGLDMLGRDVAAKAYRTRTGPFRWHPMSLPDPRELSEASPAYREALVNLYERILFRAPSEQEIDRAFELLQNVYRSGASLLEQEGELGFKLTVHDPSTGLSKEQWVSVPVFSESLGLYQQWIDQSKGQALGEGEKYLREQKLDQRIRLSSDLPGQRLMVHRLQNGEAVSLAAIRLKSLAEDYESVMGVTHASVVRDGAWKLNTRNGFESFEHEPVAQGPGYIELPLHVPHDGEYEVSLIWRGGNHLSQAVSIEVYAPNETRLAMPDVAAIPERGKALFTYDSSEDARPFAELPVTFQFGEQDFIEVNNHGTDQRVTIGALGLVPAQGGDVLEIDSREAEGNEDWVDFKSRSFRAYNQKGTQIEDENKNKGERFLRFRPNIKTKLWHEGAFYQIRIHYPGKRDHETHVPVVVHAAQSSPMVRVYHPTRAKSGSEFVVDASSSYTVQHSALQFHWEQTKGVPVTFLSVGPMLKVQVNALSLEEAAWTALTRGLIRHPDFLFTRPPSLAHVKEQDERKALQLVKVALDLLGRPPTQEEFEQVGEGGSIEAMVDRYLSSQAFRDDYYRRIRLYLESQGTVLQDEPARLWCYVAFNDLPFSEILTADYTVGPGFIKQDRPAYHGSTGVLTTKGFIDGKPGLPHYNYAAQVSMLFLGYVYELPPEINAAREGITAHGTTDPGSMCYSCHKILTPLAFQRSHWTDDGDFRTRDEKGVAIRADDRGWVEDYPFKGEGMEAFATQAVKKERFIRTMINTHFHFYFGRSMRHLTDERVLYKRLWDNVHENGFQIRSLIRSILTSPEYMQTNSGELAAEAAKTEDTFAGTP